MTGREIIKAAMKRHRIGPKDFFGTSHLAHIVKVRRIAVRRLLEAGFTKAACARLMKRHWSTIQYYASPERRARRRLYYRDYHKAHRAKRIATYWARKSRNTAEASG